MEMPLVEVFSARTTSGHWGLAVYGPDGMALPAQGSLRPVGDVAGVRTYVFSPGETGEWAMIAGDVTVASGARVVCQVDLPGGQVMSLLLLGPQAVIEHHGHKRRSSVLAAYRDGLEAELSGAALASLGLIPAAVIA